MKKLHLSDNSHDSPKAEEEVPSHPKEDETAPEIAEALAEAVDAPLPTDE